MTRRPNPALLTEIRNIVSEEIHLAGVDGLTMRRIATRAGITPTTLYYYFQDRQHLLDTIKLDAVREMDEYILGSLRPSDPPLLQLDSLIRSFLRWALENPKIMELVFEGLPPKTGPDEVLKDYYRSQTKAIELVYEGVKSGDLACQDPRLDVTVLFGMLYGTLKLYLDKRVLPEYWNDFAPLADRVIQIVLGTLARPARTTKEGEGI